MDVNGCIDQGRLPVGGGEELGFQVKAVLLFYSCVSLHSGQELDFLWMDGIGLGDALFGLTSSPMEKREQFANPIMVPTCNPQGLSVATMRATFFPHC